MSEKGHTHRHGAYSDIGIKKKMLMHLKQVESPHPVLLQYSWRRNLQQHMAPMQDVLWENWGTEIVLYFMSSGNSFLLLEGNDVFHSMKIFEKLQTLPPQPSLQGREDSALPFTFI